MPDRAPSPASFLYSCAGYFDYEHVYSPLVPDIEAFAGEVVHPQFWPEDLEYDGKRVVIIGSGATAVTLVPAMAGKAAHVTMLQRSPTWIGSIPGRDKVADRLRRLLPAKLAHRVIRTKNIVFMLAVYNFCKRFPDRARRLLSGMNEKILEDPAMVAEHFTPSYNPWDQRLCAVPDADLFRSIKRGEADVVTGRIESFVPEGIRLANGQVLEADIVVTATGLKLLPFGGIDPSVDGVTVDLSRAVRLAGRDAHRRPELRRLHRLQQRLLDVAGRPQPPPGLPGAQLPRPARLRRHRAVAEAGARGTAAARPDLGLHPARDR